MKLILNSLTYFVASTMNLSTIFISALVFSSTLIFGQTNCENARKKYLESNPDVAKAQMDAWTHYTYFGKDEGRIWPDCSAQESESKNGNKNSVGSSNNFQETPLVNDLRIEFLVALGKASQKPQKFVTHQGAHNKFKFYNKPLYTLTEISPKEFKPQKSFNDYKKELDEILVGMDSLSSKINALEAELNDYKTEYCCGNSAEFYRFYSGNCLGQDGRVGDLYIINDPSFNEDKIRKWSKSCSEGRRVDYCDWATCSGITFFTTARGCEKFDRKIASATKLKKVTRLLDLTIKDRKQFLNSVTGLDEEYFVLKDELMNAQNLLSFAKRLYFKTLEQEVNLDCQQFNYVGLLEKDQPNGFGYLLTKDNQIVLSGFWQNGFPVLIYEVNGYHNSKGESFFYRYRPTGSQLGANKLCIDTKSLRYKSGITSFGLYIGEYEGNKPIEWSGYGSYFHDYPNENDLQYYQGYWKRKKKDGYGTFNANAIYTGLFKDDEFKSGVCTLTSGEKLQGEFQNWELQGIGEVTSANGESSKGYYENGRFIKSVEQYQQDLEAERARLLKLQYGKQIKDRFRDAFLKIALSGGVSESKLEDIALQVISDIETNVIDRKLTNEDKDIVLELANETAKEIKLGLMMANTIRQNSSETESYATSGATTNTSAQKRNVYVCTSNKTEGCCLAVVVSENGHPKSSGCCPRADGKGCMGHSWSDCGPSGKRTFQCSGCGIVVSVKGFPEGGGCCIVRNCMGHSWSEFK